MAEELKTSKTNDRGQMQLNLNTLSHIDGGRVQLVFDHSLRQMVTDVVERPGDKGRRTLTLKIEAAPVLDQNSAALDSIDLVFTVGCVTPKRRNPQAYRLLALADGTAMFQPGSPHDPRQLGLPFKAEEVEAVEDASEQEAAEVDDDEEVSPI